MITMTTIRDCTIKICREMGMSEEELARFIKDQDEHAEPDNLKAVNTNTVEALGPMQEAFWFAMRKEIPIIVKKWREATSQTSLAE